MLLPLKIHSPFITISPSPPEFRYCQTRFRKNLNLSIFKKIIIEITKMLYLNC